MVQQHDGHRQRIRYHFGCYDSLQYPLLFPMGEPGWHQGIEKIPKGQGDNALESEPQPSVLPSKPQSAESLLASESLVFDENLSKRNMVSAREFYAYRFQIRPAINSILLHSGRLLQQFAVDMYVKIESSRLDYFRNKQDEIRAELYQGIVDSIAQGETNGSKIGKRIILPGTFIGGPRDMRKRYLDAMTLVERFDADRAWFVKRITDNNPYTRPTLPAGYQHILQRYNREVWILLKNGSRVWPVQIVDNQFRGGWTEFYRAHALSSDYEIFFGCERNWIYEVAIFDQYHARVKYSWSSPNESLEFIYPPPAGLTTSILPSIFFNQQALMQFSYRCEQGTHIYQEFARRLGPILSNIEEYEVVFKMDLHEWTVPVQQGVLHRSTFEAFIADLKLGTSDYVLITMSPQMVARVIVFGFNGLEKVSSMF